MMRKPKPQNAPAAKSELTHTLTDLGEEQAVAAVTSTLLEKGACLVPEIEKHTGYSYATVNQALKALESRGWLETQEHKTPARGRNPLKYRLGASKTKLTQHYKKIFETRLARVEKRL